MLVVVHVPLKLAFAIVDGQVHPFFPLATRVPLDGFPRVGHACFGATEPAERLLTRATYDEIAAAGLFHWHGALRARLRVCLHTGL